MNKIFVWTLLAILALAALVGCAAPAPTPAPTSAPPTAAPKATEAPKATAVPPTAAPAGTTAPTAAATTAAQPTAAPKAGVRTKANAGETITFFHFGDVTGPYAGITTPLVSGFNDAVKALNDKGGIRGAKINIEWADTAGKLENAISTYNRFREKKPLILFMYGSPETEALRDRLIEDKIPALTAGVSGKGMYPPGYAFAEVPIYSDQFGMFLDWISANWSKVKPPKGQNTDIPRISVVTWDTAYGRGALTPETQAYADKKGVKIIGQELFAQGAPDVTTQILAAKKAGANVLYTNTLAHGPAQILKDAASLGVKEEFLIAGNNWALDTSMLALAKDAAEGFYGVLPNMWYDEADHAGIKEVEAQFKANNRKPAEHSVGYLLSYAFVDAMTQVLEKTIDRVGFEGLTGAAVQETMASMSEIKSLSGVMVLEYGKDKRSPSKARIVQVQKGKFVPLTDWMVAPDLRPK